VLWACGSTACRADDPPVSNPATAAAASAAHLLLPLLVLLVFLLALLVFVVVLLVGCCCCCCCCRRLLPGAGCLPEHAVQRPGRLPGGSRGAAACAGQEGRLQVGEVQGRSQQRTYACAQLLAQLRLYSSQPRWQLTQLPRTCCTAATAGGCCCCLPLVSRPGLVELAGAGVAAPLPVCCLPWPRSGAGRLVVWRRLLAIHLRGKGRGAAAWRCGALHGGGVLEQQYVMSSRAGPAPLKSSASGGACSAPRQPRQGPAPPPPPTSALRFL
jgi:hypothetical protein